MAVNHIVCICKYRAGKSERLQMRNSHSHTHTLRTHAHTQLSWRHWGCPCALRGENKPVHSVSALWDGAAHHTDVQGCACLCVSFQVCACLKELPFHICVKKMTVTIDYAAIKHQCMYATCIYELQYKCCFQWLLFPPIKHLSPINAR